MLFRSTHNMQGIAVTFSAHSIPVFSRLRFALFAAFALLTSACGSTNPFEQTMSSSAEPDAEAAQQSPAPVNRPNPFDPVDESEANQLPSRTPAAAPEPEPVQQGAALPEVDVETEEIIPAIPAVASVTQASCSADPATMQQRMLQLINEARATARTCGADSYEATDPLRWNTTLETAAREHSTDMATVNFFSHTGSNGSSASERVTAAGYSWRTVGENIAAGQTTAAQAINGWIDSPGHCANIMNPSFKEVAVACVQDDGADFPSYWTNVLAAPR